MSIFKPIKNKRIYQQIVEQIRELIADGTLSPGDKLMSERAMAEELNVSRASIREAFSVLEMLGLIESRPGEGTFIKEVKEEMVLEPLALILASDVDNIFELIETRKILEVESAALAAKRATEDDLENIKQVIDEMKEAINQGKLGDQADAKFHFAVAKATHNQMFVRVMYTISDLLIQAIGESRKQLFKLKDNNETLYEQHKQVYEEIVNNNPQKAREAMYHHLETTRKELNKLI
ncbi:MULTISPECIES: FadR/GntR family transcriptional regulator [unclassified Candidatus Frackibacter]|uniref:FadR/GntR family transcriptional regulator n=1 Tax=unclassified Candidatus Frackibacter TaxID=2648818 RepID=UPI00079564C0|nr:MULTISPECIES: FadR/GntR family transcriptional regulator [unclassified Candidatus Frackibacter]KXS43517.1 MAG: GntR family transcriptional regulator, transcriptional repressor for pyruvate dehydrogenase complex [Candidatus Frackibacter sp. T328-2]SDC15219.1 transcriptional regulator, GntR family [Candidatus Frackibacter sp. WG11]SEM46506.1 transcriptional regulator, GntR family [Candidatus Frackibacter sp. WG12]SFL48430.1 transcriptional regulator, GntR family [Candidatus Frackibacter sp. WG